MLQTLPPTSCPPSSSFSPAAHSHFPLPHRLSAPALPTPSSSKSLPWPFLTATPKSAFFSPPAASSSPTFPFSPLPFAKLKQSQRRRRLSSSSSGDDAQIAAFARSKRRKRDDPFPPPTPPRAPSLLASLPTSVPSPFLLARRTDLPRTDNAKDGDDMDVDVFSWPQLEDLGLPLSAEEEAVLPEREGGRKAVTGDGEGSGRNSGSASPASSIGGGATDENQHGEEREEGLKPSLFRLLPAEVISHILLLAETERHSAPLLPLSFNDNRDLINKRAHHRFLPLDGFNDWQPILDLASRGDEQRLAVCYVCFVPGDHSGVLEYQCAILKSLKNLRRLEIEHFDEPLPRPITALIASCRHLTSLRLYRELEESWTLEDQTFSIGRDLPSLERFQAYIKCPLPQLLSTPCPNLKHLEVFVDTHERDSFDCLPWLSLTSLTLFLTDSTTKSVKPLRFLSSSLQRALVPAEGDQQASPLPLRRLQIGNIAFFSSKHEGEEVSSTASKAFFDLLKPLPLVSLTIELSGQPHSPKNGTALPSVKTLHLSVATKYGSDKFDARQQDTAKRLSSIIACFPAVEFISLDGIKLAHVGHAKDPPDSFEFMLERPTLFALISFVKQFTSVVRLDWRPDNWGMESYRWTRWNRDEDFCGERYRRF